MTLQSIPPGMKIAAQINPEPSEEDVQFIRQMGVDYVVVRHLEEEVFLKENPADFNEVFALNYQYQGKALRIAIYQFIH